MKTFGNILNYIAIAFVFILIGNNSVVFFNVQNSIYVTVNPLIIKIMGILSIFIMPTMLDMIRRKSDEKTDIFLNLITGISLAVVLLLIDLLFKSKELTVFLYIIMSLALLLHKK
ncbi:MAG: hypothetical protein JW870_10985 [Candidatus Delongbacteria bacterium]|nr:hypothetical protein [Candidatus Delongbacteria bacterium]